MTTEIGQPFCDPARLAPMKPGYFTLCQGDVEIEEKAEAGKGVITFSTDQASMKVVAVGSNSPLRWMSCTKCADGAIVLREGAALVAHIVELKSKIRSSDWTDIRLQFEGMLANVRSAVAAMDLPLVQNIVCHLAYKEQTISPENEADTVNLKYPVGDDPASEGDTSPAAVQWMAGTIPLHYQREVKLMKIARDSAGNGVGSLSV
jgi:hypothetical protein